MIDKIREWFFYREFRQSVPDKKRQKPKTNEAQSIAILYERTCDEDQRAVEKLKNKLNANGKKHIFSLAYLNNENPLPEEYGKAYNKKSIKWNRIPFGNEVAEFLAFQADVLIVLHDNMSLTLEFLIANSNAQLIVGADLAGAENYFNLIVELKKNYSIENLISSILSMSERVAISNKQ